MTTLAPSFFEGSSSFLQVTRTTIKAEMSLIFCQTRPPTTELPALSLNFGPIPSLTMELAALEHLKIIVSSCFLCNFYSDLFNTCR